MATTRRQYEQITLTLVGRQIMTEYSRLLHGSSSESEASATVPLSARALNGKPALSGTKKKRSQHLENPAPTARINYLQSPMLIERGDWVVRLREGDPSSMAKLDETDIWDGPYPVIELPPAADEENEHINITGDAASPVKEIPRVKLRFPLGSKGDPWTYVNRLIPVYPDPPRPDGPTPGSEGVIFHLRKGSATFVELQRFRPRGMKDKELYIVGRLRGRRGPIGSAGTEYLVHWAGWPSEDDTWEKVDGIPESFRQEYDKAKASKYAVSGSKTPKAKKDKLPIAGKDTPANTVVKGGAPGSGKKIKPTKAIVTAVPDTLSPHGTRSGGPPVNSPTTTTTTTNNAVSPGWRRTTPARKAQRPVTPKPQTRAHKPTTPSPLLKKPPTSVPTTPVTPRVLGKRSRSERARQQTPPAEVMTGKRRRLASVKGHESTT